MRLSLFHGSGGASFARRRYQVARLIPNAIQGLRALIVIWRSLFRGLPRGRESVVTVVRVGSLAGRLLLGGGVRSFGKLCGLLEFPDGVSGACFVALGISGDAGDGGDGGGEEGN